MLLRAHDGLRFASDERTGRLGPIFGFELLLALLHQFLLHADLRLVVEPVVHGLLALRALRLWVHELRLRWVQLLGDLLPDALVPLVLSVQERFLVRNELLLRPALVTLSWIGDGFEFAFLRYSSLVCFDSFLLDFTNALLLPRGKSLNIFTCVRLRLHLSL